VRRAGRLLAAAIVALVATAFASPAAAAAPGSRPGAANADRVRDLVVVAVPGLRWSDVAQLPALRAFVATAAIGNLSVRNGAEPGAFGAALHTAGWRTITIGDAASALLADRSGRVDISVSGDGTSRAVSRMAPRMAAAFLDDELGATTDRNRAMHDLDAQLQQQLALANSHTVLVVAGVGDGATGPAHAHVLAISGPGWGHSGITSGTTHHAGWAQLVDIPSTLLAAADIPVPESMAGKPIGPSGAAPSISSLVDDDAHARAAATAKFWTVSGICVAAGLSLLLLLARRRRLGGILAGVAAAAPIVTYLGQLLPWWRWPLLLDAALLLLASVVAAVAVGRLALRSVPVAAVVVPAVTAAVLAADQLAGAPLQLSAPLGDNPLVAGRFHGMGNVAFAVFGASALLCAAFAAARAGSPPRGRLAAIATAVALGLLAMAVDGAPTLGDDFGGLLALTVAVIVLGLLVSGARITWWRAVLAVLAAVAAAAAVALADYARPASAQTHLGRFVGDLLHGRSDVISRKADLALHSFGNSAVTGLVVVAVLAAIATREQVRAAARRVPGLAAGWVSVAVLGVVGSVVNDSGIVIAALAVVVGLLPPVAAMAIATSGEYWPGDGRGR
jgi:hypothetical protein